MMKIFKKKREVSKGVVGCTCSKSVFDRMSEFEPFLKELERAPPSKRVLLLEGAPSCLIRLLCECGLNILRGNLKLNKNQYESLKPYKSVLLKLSRPFTNLKERRQDLSNKREESFGCSY